MTHKFHFITGDSKGWSHNENLIKNWSSRLFKFRIAGRNQLRPAL